MTQQQLNTLLAGIVAQINGGRAANARNNAAPNYAVPPEQVLNAATGDMEDSPLGKRFQDGTDVKITDVQWNHWCSVEGVGSTDSRFDKCGRTCSL